jgi:hypothetical protein
MAKCDVFETHSSGNLPTLGISVRAVTIFLKILPCLSQARNAAVVGVREKC